MGVPDLASDLETARDHLSSARFDAALEACGRALASDPGNFDAERLIASVVVERGRLPLAILAIQRLALRRPDDATLPAWLAYVLRATGDLSGASRAVEEALALDADCIAARIERANLHRERGEVAAAVGELRGCLERAAENAEVLCALAGALREAGELTAARRTFEQAVAIDASLRTRHIRRASWYRTIRDEAHAVSLLEEGADLQPGDPELQHMLAAARGDASAPRATDRYLVQHFDGFAASFDTVLTQHLGYRVPEQLADMLAALADDRAGSLEVLDAGCGTGLGGPPLRSLARRLVGVDLSPGMLERARARGAYDELVVEELSAFLRDHTRQFDAIVLADVFIYFGDLREIIALIAGALRSSGLVAFSTELAERQRTLGLGGRWAHTEQEAREACRAAGLEILDVRASQLRLERSQPVMGQLVTGRLTA